MYTLYTHAHCRDGFASAWLAQQYLDIDDVVFLSHTDPAPDVRGKHVLMVDFSYPRAVIAKMYDDAESFTLLDHHETAKQLQGFPYCIIDNRASGAMLLLDFMRTEWEIDVYEGIQAIIAFVDVADRWKWDEIPNSREIIAAIDSYPRDYDTWDSLPSAIPTLYNEGTALLRYKQQQVDALLNNKQFVFFGGYPVYAVNTSFHQSDVGNVLSQGQPFGIAWWVDAKNVYHYSLRSNTLGINVAELAQQYGGGGHVHAAGCNSKTPLHEVI